MIRSLSAKTLHYSSIVKNTLIFNDKMPSIYVDSDFHVDDSLKRSMYSIEHVFPRSFIKKQDCSDMHNTFRTINELNTQRSNYRFVDIRSYCDNDKKWTELSYGNYVNHKEKLFIPNKSSRGFIARSILYMAKQYNYKPTKIIDKQVLIDWFYEYPPNKTEKYHNEMVMKIQNRNNIFISSYNRKAKNLLKFIDKF
jgi:endonuclease I